jgi:hypothetical protein
MAYTQLSESTYNQLVALGARVSCERSPFGEGWRYLVECPNGYSASIVKHPFSYGGNEGFWELAVVLHGRLVYDTPVTSDVEGWLTEDDVLALAREVAALEAVD